MRLLPLPEGIVTYQKMCGGFEFSFFVEVESDQNNAQLAIADHIHRCSAARKPDAVDRVNFDWFSKNSGRLTSRSDFFPKISFDHEKEEIVFTQDNVPIENFNDFCIFYDLITKPIYGPVALEDSRIAPNPIDWYNALEAVRHALFPREDEYVILDYTSKNLPHLTHFFWGGLFDGNFGLYTISTPSERRLTIVSTATWP